MTSLYQTLREYFIYEDLYTLDFIKGECAKEISWRQLKRLFKVTIKKSEVDVYQKRYRLACEDHLQKLSRAGRRGGKLWNFLSDLVSSEKFFFFSNTYPRLQNLELFLNTCVFVGSFFVSSSTYLLAFPGGRSLINNLFSKQDLTSIINFYLYIYAVQTMGSFDDFIFQEDIVKMLPYVSLPASIVKTLGLPPSVMQEGEKVLEEWMNFYASNLISIENVKNLS